MGAAATKRNSTLWNSTTETRDTILQGVNFRDPKVIDEMHKAVSKFKLADHADHMKPFETKVSDSALSQVLK